mgnify:CR=1 FL=1
MTPTSMLSIISLHSNPVTIATNNHSSNTWLKAIILHAKIKWFRVFFFYKHKVLQLAIRNINKQMQMYVVSFDILCV